MKGSLNLGMYAGIGVYLHWTFLLLLGWLLVADLRAGWTFLQAVFRLDFIVALFFCVVLHEFGHALTARRFGVRTRDITLFPIGGLARLERIPDKPMQEFWVAVAGPAVNLAIAAILFTFFIGLGGMEQLLQVKLIGGTFLPGFIWINLLLAGFNLLPAFPLDGGRVLRALLATGMDRSRATFIAGNVGQVMAVALGIYGFLSNNVFLVLIAIFIFFGAREAAANPKT